jgi:hypothetical protein
MWQELVSQMNQIDDYYAENRLNLAKTAFQKNNVSISIDIFADILKALNGTNRCRKLIDWVIPRNYIMPTTITPNAVSEMLKKCNLIDIDDEITSKLKHYKKISNGIPKYVIDKSNIPKTFDKDIIHTTISSRILNPPKNKRYPTPERKLEVNKRYDIHTIKIYTYEELINKIANHEIDDLACPKYEINLADDEFINVFQMQKDEFYKLAEWKQIILKKKYKLF